MSPELASRARSRFDTEYSPLQKGSPRLGEIALLPWDSEAFGFAVADYRPGEARDLIANSKELEERLAVWSRENGVELTGCRVAGNLSLLAAVLERAGFGFIELQLRATVPRLRAENLPGRRMTVRAAGPGDSTRILEIAGTVFNFGRYHADPRFPRRLADLRYRLWMERALSKSATAARVYVIGAPGQPVGFLHAEVEESVADIRLAAVDREQAGLAGPELFLGALHELAAEGATRATARVSAANSAVLNIYGSLGFRFHEPELVLHWHRPGSAHLLPLADSSARPEGSDGPNRAR